MENKIGTCPHCGQVEHVFLNLRAYGYAKQFYTLDGAAQDLDVDRVGYKESWTLRCATCKKVRTDLRLSEDQRSVISRKARS